ncbi:MAG: hypothetical protein JXR23_11020 [Pontiellaceae bacterium]|nr:hypothetical protein [Pontiellaceae bacterium]
MDARMVSPWFSSDFFAKPWLRAGSQTGSREGAKNTKPSGLDALSAAGGFSRKRFGVRGLDRAFHSDAAMFQSSVEPEHSI